MFGKPFCLVLPGMWKTAEKNCRKTAETSLLENGRNILGCWKNHLVTRQPNMPFEGCAGIDCGPLQAAQQETPIKRK